MALPMRCRPKAGAQGRAGQGRAGPGKAGQGRAGHTDSELAESLHRLVGVVLEAMVLEQEAERRALQLERLVDLFRGKGRRGRGRGRGRRRVRVRVG